MSGIDDLGWSLVIDNGSFRTKCGFGGDDYPRWVFPTIVARREISADLFDSKYYFFAGDDAKTKKDSLSLQYPVKHGLVTHWGDMRRIWHHCFRNELRVDEDEHPVLLTEHPLTPKKDREEAASDLFDYFKIPYLFFSTTSTLNLLTSGMTMGCSFECGYSLTTSVPVFDENDFFRCTESERWKSAEKIKPFQFASKILNFGGRDVSESMKKILTERSYETFDMFFHRSEIDIFREMKEKVCFLSEDFDKDVACEKIEHELEYDLPDGISVLLDTERFRAPELLFKPELVGLEHIGIHELIDNSINAIKEPEFQKIMYRNIVLGGGSTMYPGIKKRLESEIRKLAPPNVEVKIHETEMKEFSAFIGGSILTSLSSFHPYWLSKGDYNEFGPSVLSRKGRTDVIENEGYLERNILEPMRDERIRRDYLKKSISEEEDAFSIVFCGNSNVLKTCKSFLRK